MPSLIISPQSAQQIVSLQETERISRTTPPIPLVYGESLDAYVLGHDRDHKILLQIKNSTLIADSRLSLQAGEKLTVRVDQLHPGIVLRILNSESMETLQTNEFLKQYRSNPDALKDMITSARLFLSGDSLKELSNFISPRDIQAIHKVLDQIILSKSNSANPLFIKDYITALGLVLESGLMKTLTGSASPKDEKNGQTLKEILLKLSSEFTELYAAPGSMDPEAKQKIKPFSDFVDQALKVIESLQVVNVLAREQDNLFALQVPFQCPDGIRMQNIFIETDREENHLHPGKSYRVVLFLDMDALGEVVVDAGFIDKRLRCTIKCDNQNVLDFMSPFLSKVQEKLSGIGYSACSVQCVLDRDLPSWKQDYLSDHKVFSQNIIHLCA